MERENLGRRLMGGYLFFIDFFVDFERIIGFCAGVWC